ncbi:MAG: T9SS type A sorting domain-containing protein [Bacteroidetes bacterium]|nr:T9SS type A sorting domain-containing protein [Bacteroidota bacterium]
MNTMRNHRSFVLLLLLLLSRLTAQDTASVVWPLTAATTIAPSTAGYVLAQSELFRNTEVNQYTGFNASQRIRITGNAWPLNQTTQIETVFVQFTVRPKAGVSLNVSWVKLYLAGNSGSNMRAKVFWSTDSTFTARTELYAGAANLPNNTGFDSAWSALNAAVPAGGAFHVRVYPWLHNQTGSNTGKYLLLQNVVIAGTTTGTAVIDLPTVTTTPIFNVSDVAAVSGGTIVTDGGGAVTQRGVCWDTVSGPTTASSVQLQGSGSGSFVSSIAGLTPGRTYFLRAFATNSSGTAYGAEHSFTTLLVRTAPIVTTSAVNTILATSATGGGSVTGWGGDTVTQRGICWSTAPGPTTTDHTIAAGSGTGSFSAVMKDLIPSTTYYVRAYAVNKNGTGYGVETSFTTQAIAPTVRVTVAKTGPADYTTVQAAFNAVPANYTGSYIIFVRKGVYKEKLLLATGKVNVVLIGEDRDSTILTYDDYAGKSGGTSTSYSTAIDADDFTAMNITFQNTVKNDGTFADQQAVALRVNGDRQAYYNCRLLGYQDTYYTWGGKGVQRTYHWKNIIEGSVDFIFGRNIVVFDSCTIVVNRNGGTITAAATEPGSQYGYVFRDCSIAAPDTGFNGIPVTSFYLGRPWQSAPRTVFLRTHEPATLHPAGWLAWNVPPALYAEYKSTGPGSSVTQRVAWSSQLSDSAAALYTLANIFGKNASSPAFSGDWLPVRPVEAFPTSVGTAPAVSTVPAAFRVEQNYPNPFNPETMITFTVQRPGTAVVTVRNLLGQHIAEPFRGAVQPGVQYHARFSAAGLSSGVYFYTVTDGRRAVTKRMVLQR